MRIGLDLDHTVYGFPEFFREFIPAMVACEHRFYCISNHTQKQWHKRDRGRLVELGINPDLIDPSLMPIQPVTGPSLEARQARKAAAISKLDIAFDDYAEFIQPHTRTPVFRTPRSVAADRSE